MVAELLIAASDSTIRQLRIHDFVLTDPTLFRIVLRHIGNCLIGIFLASCDTCER